MNRDSERILTTHTGSLARPAALREMLVAMAGKKAIDVAAFETECLRAVGEAVKRQREVGLDIINDGEMSKTGFAQYIRERLNGFEGDPVVRVTSLEGRDFPEAAGAVQMQQPCRGPLSWKDFSALERDIARLKSATQGLTEKQVFMTSVSPGSLVNNNPNHFYPTRGEYLAAAADVMKREYEAIAAAGFIVQLDSPDLAQRSYNFPDLPFDQWRNVVAENIEALNTVTKSIPQERIRVHVCWGANEGPHNHDTELKDLVDLLLKARCGAISVVGANGRHDHEWRVWESVKLPAGMSLIAGVIDSTTNIIEHPRTVAERLARLARVLGRENIIGGVDCGFGTIGTTKPQVDPQVVWAKLRSLVEGAALAASVI